MALPMQQPTQAQPQPGRFIPDAGNQRRLRDALGCFATGVTVVTAPSAQGTIAITVNSFASVSLTPPLVLWSLDRNTARYNSFVKAEHYAIHILNEDQADLCFEIAGDAMRLQDDPLLHYQIRFDCTREALYPAGDHVIILGRIQQVTEQTGARPLLFYQGRTGSFNSHDGR